MWWAEQLTFRSMLLLNEHTKRYQELQVGDDLCQVQLKQADWYDEGPMIGQGTGGGALVSQANLDKWIMDMFKFKFKLYCIKHEQLI